MSATNITQLFAYIQNAVESCLAMSNAKKWLSHTHKNGIFFNGRLALCLSFFKNGCRVLTLGIFKKASGFLTETLWQAC